jgi:hypothetical protein
MTPRRWRAEIVTVVVRVTILVLLLLSAGAADQRTIPVAPAAPSMVAPTGLPAVASLPLLRYPTVPRIAKVQGTFVARVTTDGTAAVDVHLLRTHPMFEPQIIANLKAWRFVPHAPTTFDVTFSFEQPWALEDCWQRPEEMAVSLPSRVVIRAASGYCEYIVRVRGGQRLLTGNIVCDCPQRRPIEGARVSVIDISDRVVATVRTDSRGHFIAPPIPDGTYRVRAESAGFWTATGGPYEVRDNGADWDMTLGLQPGFLDIESAELPVYPARLKSQRIEGIVHLEIANGDVRPLDGPHALAEAAAANVRTWKYRPSGSGPLPVTLTYRLRSREECQADSRDQSELHADGVAIISACP